MSVVSSPLRLMAAVVLLPVLVSCRASTAKTPLPPLPQTSPVKPGTTGSFSLGTNLLGIADWSTQYPFLNYFKNSRTWITRGTTVWDTEERGVLRLDPRGWVKSLTGGRFTSVGTFIPNDGRGRRFVVLYEGAGTLEYTGLKKEDATSRPGREVVIAPPGQPLYVGITKTDPQGTGNYLRNLRIIPEAEEKIAQLQAFNPDFLKSLKGYSVLRFMDWMNTNGSQQTDWTNRPQPGDMSYVERGVPVEVMVDLANQTGISPWFNMPHQATDDYVRGFATYVKAHLNPKLKVYVEYSNEVWNSQFSQAGYAQEQGKRAFATVQGSDFDKQLLWFGQRTGQVLKIWDQVYGSDRAHVIGVLAVQAANTYTSSKSLEPLLQKGMTLQGWGVDALAIAPYFGSYLGTPEQVSTLESWTREPDRGLTKLFQELTQGGLVRQGPSGGALQEAVTWMQDYAQLARSQGLLLLAYEGGQHLVGVGGVENNQPITDLLIAANRDLRMGELYKAYLQQWKQQGGGLFAHFTDVGSPSKWGSWGARESLYQASSPKSQALDKSQALQSHSP